MSASVIGEEINRELSTSFSRCSVVGRARRLGVKLYGTPGAHRTIRVRPVAPKKKMVTRIVGDRVVDVPIFEDPVVLDAADLAPLHVSFMDLKQHHCRYPYGHENFTFCGHRKVAGSSYCQPHHLICHGIGTYSERTATKLTGRVLEGA